MSSENHHDVGVDRISQLSDGLIGEILSQLPPIDAVKTDFLSHQWRHQWKSMTTLNFCLGRTDRNVKLVTSTLLHHKNKSSISRFSVSCYHVILAEVDKWIEMLTTDDAQVKEVTLHFKVIDKPDEFYVLKETLYNAPFITKLDIACCRVCPPPGCSIRWDSLKSLTFQRYVYFSLNFDCFTIDNAIMKKILEGSPVLEVLRLHAISCDGTLHLSHDNLKQLEVHWLRGGGEIEIKAPKIEIMAPSLELLIFDSLLYMGDISVVKAASPCRCRLNFVVVEEGVVMDLGPVEHLTIGPQLLKTLSGNWVVGRTPPTMLVGHCKFLALESSIRDWDWNLAGMDTALRSSPLLEILFLNLTARASLVSKEDGSKESNNERCERYLSDENDHWSRNMKPAMLHLRTISITLEGDEGALRKPVNLVRLVQLFLTNATTLEKLIVSAPGGGCNQTLFEMGNKFKDCPNKLSPRAVVQFMHRSN